MAEVVDYRLGKTLDEINVLIKFGLLNEVQVREIYKRREEHEYSLRRRTNDVLRTLKYIKFEMNLLKSIEDYKKTIATKSSEDQDGDIFKLQAKKLAEIVRSRVGHISFMYRKLIMKNQFDKRLWAAYIEFAKERKLLSRVSALYWRMLRVVSSDVSLWLDAADFEIETVGDLNTARRLLLLGLRHNPESKALKDKLRMICDVPSLAEHSDSQPGDQSCAKESNASDKTTPCSLMDQLYQEYDANGVESTRHLYKTLGSSVRNQKLSLYVGMLQVEMWQLSKDESNTQLDRIRSIYDQALMKFGRTKAKLWYEYLQFEYKYAKTLDDFDRINRIYSRAQATVDASKVNRVIEKYNLLQTRPDSSIDVEYSDYSDLENS